MNRKGDELEGIAKGFAIILLVLVLPFAAIYYLVLKKIWNLIRNTYESIEVKKDIKRRNWCDKHRLSINDVEWFTVKDAKRRGMVNYRGLYYINCEDWLNWPQGIRLFTSIPGHPAIIKDQSVRPQCNFEGPSDWGIYPIDAPESITASIDVDE